MAITPNFLDSRGLLACKRVRVPERSRTRLNRTPQAAHPLYTLSYERALFWNFPQINQMTFKLPYILGISMKYYTVPVVSCVVLGHFEGLWFCCRRQATFPNGRHNSSRILPEILHFCKSPAGQLRWRRSQDVWAHSCKNLGTQSILTLGKS